MPPHLGLCNLPIPARFADEFRRRYTQLHLLVNNAGLNTIGHPDARSADGFELCFAVNFLGATRPCPVSALSLA